MTTGPHFSLATRALELIRDLILALTALFAVVWICHRAWVQSITVDEADTFLHWIAPGEPSHWFPHSNNHVLNSLLIRFFVWLFGLSPMALRAPALIGGALYIAASYCLCNLVARAGFLRVALFVSCVYNPFIMASRGGGEILQAKDSPVVWRGPISGMAVVVRNCDRSRLPASFPALPKPV